VSLSPRAIETFQDAIRKLHGCESIYVESVTVREPPQGPALWIRTVHVFDLQGHPTATRCYTWDEDLNQVGRGEAVPCGAASRARGLASRCRQGVHRHGSQGRSGWVGVESSGGSRDEGSRRSRPRLAATCGSRTFQRESDIGSRQASCFSAT
jgi:hypothetical protein